MALKRRGYRPPLYRTPEARDFLMRDKVVGVVKELSGEGVVRAGAGDATLWVLSDASKDRYGDTVSVDGHQLDAYRRNPVLLWAHDSEAPPVGRIPDVYVESSGEEGRLMGKMGAGDWVPRDVQPFAWAVSQMVKLGFLNAVSIGFLPVEFTFNDDWTMNFKRQELLEVSVVPVPANANALAEARSKGFWIPEIDAWMERRLDERKPGPTLEIARNLWSITKRASVAMPGSHEEDEAELEGGDLVEVREMTDAVRENTAVQRELLDELRAERAERKSVAVTLERRTAIGRAGKRAAAIVARTLKKV